MFQIHSSMRKIIFYLSQKRFLLVALDQYFLSFTSIFISFLCFHSLDKTSLADFVMVWAGIWGLVAILSETLVNPLRLQNNASTQQSSLHTSITEILAFLYHSGLSFLLVGSILLKYRTLSSVFLGLSVVLLYTRYTITRNIYIDSQSQQVNLKKSAIVLILIVLSLTSYSYNHRLTLFVLLLFYPLCLIFVQFEKINKITTYVIGILSVTRIIFQNVKFGVSTVLRILLFSILILFFLRLAYPAETTIEYGLIMSLSNPGIILASVVSQTEYRELLNTKCNHFNLANYFKYYGKIFYLTLVGSTITATLCFTLSKFSYNYNSIIEYMGFLKILIFSFFSILFISLSGFISAILQIYRLRDLQILAVTCAGILSIGFLFIFPPLISVFTPYMSYILVIVVLQSRKGLTGVEKNLPNP